jgi:hypothetical protein
LAGWRLLGGLGRVGHHREITVPDQPRSSVTLMRAARSARSSLAWTGALATLAVMVVACGSAKPGRLSAPSTSVESSKRPAALVPLSAPDSSAAQDAQYLTDVAEADPALDSYIQAEGNVALRALLTDGSALCAFLQQGEGIDNAMASVVIGANGVESQTHLPSTVTTFNAIDAVALIALCPSEEKLVPTVDLGKIRQLGRALASERG